MNFIFLLSLILVLIIHISLRLYISKKKIESRLNLNKFIESKAEEYENLDEEDDDDIYSNLKNDLLNYVNETKKIGIKDDKYYENQMNKLSAKNELPIETNLNKYFKVGKNKENKDYIENKTFKDTFIKEENNKISAYDSIYDNYYKLN